MIRIDSPEVQAFEKEHLATLRSLAPECMVAALCQRRRRLGECRLHRFH